MQYEKNQKEQQYERYEREKNELAEREYSKYRREVERAVSDARMKAEEEFNEKIERLTKRRSKNAKFEKKSFVGNRVRENGPGARERGGENNRALRRGNVRENNKHWIRCNESFRRAKNENRCFRNEMRDDGWKSRTSRQNRFEREEALRELANAIEGL